MARFDVAALQTWVGLGASRLEQVAGRIDALNVFPVADCDTGTNVAMTVAGARDELDQRTDDTVASAATRVARSAQHHARGSSGVIVAGWLDGLAQGLAADAPPPDRLTVALARAAQRARSVVADPWPGTVLEVADQVAADVAAGHGTVVSLADAVTAAKENLAATSRHHPVLREAGVVDAGACALLVLLEVLVAVLGETSPDDAGDWVPETPVQVVGAHSEAFEVMLEVTVEVDPRTLDGSAGAVTGSGDRWRTHVHTDDPAAALAAVAADVVRVGLVRLVQGARRIVVVTQDTGLATWFATAGAVVVVPGSLGTSADLRDVVAQEQPELVLATDAELADAVGAICGDPVRAAVAVTAEPGTASELAATVHVVRVDGADPVPAVAAMQGGDVLTAVPRADQDPSAIQAVADARGLDLVLVGPASFGPSWWLGID